MHVKSARRHGSSACAAGPDATPRRRSEDAAISVRPRSRPRRCISPGCDPRGARSSSVIAPAAGPRASLVSRRPSGDLPAKIVRAGRARSASSRRPPRCSARSRCAALRVPADTSPESRVARRVAGPDRAGESPRTSHVAAAEAEVGCKPPETMPREPASALVARPRRIEEAGSRMRHAVAHFATIRARQASSFRIISEGALRPRRPASACRPPPVDRRVLMSRLR